MLTHPAEDTRDAAASPRRTGRPRTRRDSPECQLLPSSTSNSANVLQRPFRFICSHELRPNWQQLASNTASCPSKREILACANHRITVPSFRIRRFNDDLQGMRIMGVKNELGTPPRMHRQHIFCILQSKLRENVSSPGLIADTNCAFVNDIHLSDKISSTNYTKLVA